jgi:N-acylglucosamine 2-epimerase
VDNRRILELAAFHRDQLLNNVIPFWQEHSVDKEYGGFLSCLDERGRVFNTDKSIWIQGRATWMFARLYNTVDRRPKWLELAKNGYDFLVKHAFDTDGRMFFTVTRDGRPLRKRRYLFSEMFGIAACAEYCKASADEQARQRAVNLFKLILRYRDTPGLLEPKVFPQTRTVRTHAMSLAMLWTSQIMREINNDPIYDKTIDQSLHEILHYFVRPDEKALFETVGLNGERLDSMEGRCIDPGHGIESSWFIMEEGLHRHDQSLIQQALQVLDWSLELGWDREYGGILYFVDIEGKPPEQLEHDMKLWWPHNEALYALLLAYHLTGDEKYAEWYEKVHSWAFSHFPDPAHGEWFGYLHRDGSVSLRLKGNMWKGPFHLPRALLFCWKLLEKMAEQKGDRSFYEKTGTWLDSYGIS